MSEAPVQIPEADDDPTGAPARTDLPAGARGRRPRGGWPAFGGLQRLRARVRRSLGRVPRAAWVCAMVALLNAAAWSVITPPFQGRDEIDHFAYVEVLAETGALPKPSEGSRVYPPQESQALEGLHYWQTRFTSYAPSISSRAQQRTLIRDVEEEAGAESTGRAGGVGGQPPLFYAVQTVPYALGFGNVLVQLQLMRLLDALMGAITVLLIFLFLRQALPGVPRAATIGALCVALQPMFAFVTGSLNPDALIYLLSAAIFLCLARAFRRRLTLRLAIAVGLVIAAGLLTYLSFIGIAAGAILALVILAIRDWRARGRAALAAPGIAIAIGVAPALLEGAIKALSGGATFGAVSSSGALGTNSLGDEISYIWQMYLPRLPGMPHYFQGISTWREIWFDRSVGFYGWMDTMFPSWVQSLALIIAIPIALLCLRELFARREAIRARLPELAGYAAIALALLAMLGVASYRGDAIEHEAAYGEPRYLLPLLPLLGAFVTLAARGGGRRFMPVVGTALVILFLGHDILSQLQVIGRYYG